MTTKFTFPILAKAPTGSVEVTKFLDGLRVGDRVTWTDTLGGTHSEKVATVDGLRVDTGSAVLRYQAMREVNVFIASFTAHEPRKPQPGDRVRVTYEGVIDTNGNVDTDARLVFPKRYVDLGAVEIIEAAK